MRSTGDSIVTQRFNRDLNPDWHHPNYPGIGRGQVRLGWHYHAAEFGFDPGNRGNHWMKTVPAGWASMVCWLTARKDRLAASSD